jgi:hypothetical protein
MYIHTYIHTYIHIYLHTYTYKPGARGPAGAQLLQLPPLLLPAALARPAVAAARAPGSSRRGVSICRFILVTQVN